MFLGYEDEKGICKDDDRSETKKQKKMDGEEDLKWVVDVPMRSFQGGKLIQLLLYHIECKSARVLIFFIQDITHY